MTTVVADASAIIALLDREPGYERVAANLDATAVSTVNLAEVVSSLINRGIEAQEARDAVERIEIQAIPFDPALALDAGALRQTTRHKGLSLGDRACLALARRLGLPALTADRAWMDLDVGVEIHLVRDGTGRDNLP